MGNIRIIDVPPGDAPEDVRRAWVGLVLPVCDPTNDVWLGRGVLTRRPETLDGYAVEGATAVSMLSKINTDAANWWRDNAPHILQPGAILVFHAKVCEKLF